MKIKNRLVIGAMLFATLPMTVAVITLGMVAENSYQASLTHQAQTLSQRSLAATLDQQKLRIEDYFTTLHDQLRMLASDRSTTTAAADFSHAFKHYDPQLDKIRGTYRPTVSRYYREMFATQYAQLNNGTQIATSTLLNGLDNETLALQYTFLGRQSAEETVELLEASDYGRAHQRYHPYFKKFAERFGLKNLYIVNPDDGKIVYAINKQIDFATSLIDGPHADSPLARAFTLANQATAVGDVATVDFAPFKPALEQPAAFIATAIFASNRKVGAVIFQLSPARIDSLLSEGATFITGNDINEPAAQQLGATASLAIPGLTWQIRLMRDELLANEIGWIERLIPLALLITSAILIISLLTAGVYAEILIKPINSLKKYIEEIGEKSDVIKQVYYLGGDEVVSAAESVRKLLQKTSRNTHKIYQSSAQLTERMIKMAAIATQTNNDSQQQLMQSNQLVTNMDALSSAAHESTQNALAAASAAQQAGHTAQDGERLIHQTIDGIQHLASEVAESALVISELKNESDQVYSIIETIQAISEQTNLLALNAAIEATRAGDQGRGFAVVADEVRSLAQRTQQATREIKLMIENIQNRSLSAATVMERGRTLAEESVHLVSTAGDTLNTIRAEVKTINKRNQQVAESTRQQLATCDEVKENINDILASSSCYATTAEKSALAHEELTSAAQQLQQTLHQLKTIDLNNEVKLA